ncbi:MAG TPA: hypothetical protein VE782_06935 [Myxococcaceae bacterium]|nr:hypothetical protein [Myxococcaceae bacterium]
MYLVRGLLIAIAVSALAACGLDDSQFADAMPDMDGLALAISGGAAEGLSTSALSSTVAQQGLQGNEIEFLGAARNAAKQLNQAVRQVLEPVADLLSSGAGAGSTANVKVYGPVDRGNATYRLTIARVEPGRFAWKLQAKAIGAPDTDYQIVMAGRIARGTEPHRGRGVMGVNLDVLKSIDSSLPGQGQLFVGFGHGDAGITLVYLVRNFTTDPAQFDPVTAAFVGHRLLPSMLTRIRLASYYNLADSPTSAKEFVRSRVRYIPGVGGRADVLATGGDVPAGSVYLGSACWDAQENEGFYVLRQCVPGQPGSCTILQTRGDLSNCRPGTESELPPPENAGDATLEDGAPVLDVVPPAEMPSGNP